MGDDIVQASVKAVGSRIGWSRVRVTEGPPFPVFFADAYAMLGSLEARMVQIETVFFCSWRHGYDSVQRIGLATRR